MPSSSCAVACVACTRHQCGVSNPDSSSSSDGTPSGFLLARVHFAQLLGNVYVAPAAWHRDAQLQRRSRRWSSGTARSCEMRAPVRPWTHGADRRAAAQWRGRNTSVPGRSALARAQRLAAKHWSGTASGRKVRPMPAIPAACRWPPTGRSCRDTERHSSGWCKIMEFRDGGVARLSISTNNWVARICNSSGLDRLGELVHGLAPGPETVARREPVLGVSDHGALKA